MLDLIDKTLNQMSFSIEPFVIRTLRLFSCSALMRRNDWFHFLVNNPLKEFLGRIAPIGNQTVKSESFHQGHCLTQVRLLSSCQAQAQWITQPVHGDMNLCAEPTATTPQRLRGLTAAFFGRQPRKGEPARWYYQSSHFPCLGHPRSERAFVPKFPGHTSGQSAYKRCSISHIRLVIIATRNHYGLSTAQPPQNGDILLHSYQHKHSGPLQ
jgi:hypothetical protein